MASLKDFSAGARPLRRPFRGWTPVVRCQKNMEKYSARVTAIGPFVSEFLDHNILVLFGSDAPEELAEFAILHDGRELYAPLEPGDQVVIDDHIFRILAVGDVASQNLQNLGHLVLKFNGQEEVEMPGDVCIEAGALPAIEVGTTIRLIGQNQAAAM